MHPRILPSFLETNPADEQCFVAIKESCINLNQCWVIRRGKGLTTPEIAISVCLSFIHIVLGVAGGWTPSQMVCEACRCLHSSKAANIQTCGVVEKKVQIETKISGWGGGKWACTCSGFLYWSVPSSTSGQPFSAATVKPQSDPPAQRVLSVLLFFPLFFEASSRQLILYADNTTRSGMWFPTPCASGYTLCCAWLKNANPSYSWAASIAEMRATIWRLF